MLSLDTCPDTVNIGEFPEGCDMYFAPIMIRRKYNVADF